MAIHRSLVRGAALLIGCLAWCGCATVPLPAIDPSGERIFLPSPSYTTLASPLDSGGRFSCLPQPAFTEPPPIPPCDQIGPPRPPGAIGTGAAPPMAPDRLILTPTKIVAPVNSEVVLLAGLCGREGYYLTKQPIEWMMSPDSVGNIIGLAESHRPYLPRAVQHASRKECNQLAITRTSTAAHVVTRGTPLPNDDVWVNKGQTWISVSSPTEGVSHVTAVARESDNWETRRQTASIYWVDMQWVFPAPRIVRAGEPCPLRTTVTKTSTGNPSAKAVVRYDVIGGAPAFFEAGRTSLEVPTDADGHATVQLFQDPVGPGTTQVRIQILSGDLQGDGGARAVIGQGFTTVTWSSPGLALQMSGPALVARNGIATYRIEVSNPGDAPTERVSVSLELPRSLQYLNSEPSARVLGNRLEWSLGVLNAHAVQTLLLNCRAANSGEFVLTARALSSTPQVAAAVATAETHVVESGISVQFVDPPATAVFGNRVEFNFEVTNSGGLPLTNVVVRDRFDAGLQPAYQVDPARPLELNIGNLAPGETQRRGVAFIARSAGQLCHVLEATADGGHTATAQACVQVAQPVLQVDVRKAGPPQARLGDSVRFTIQVTNTGDAVLTNLQVADLADPELQPVQATQGWKRRDADRAIMWTVGTLSPRQTLTFEIECTCLRESPAARNQVEVVADGGIRETATAQLVIQAPPPPERPPAPPARPPVTQPPATQPPATQPPAARPGQLDVQVFDLDDPAEVGATATWVFVVRNLSNQPDADLQITIAIPDAFEYGSIRVRQDGNAPVTLVSGGVSIGPIRTIRGLETLPRFRVEARARQPGQYKVRVRVESRGSSPVEDDDDITIVPRN